MSSAASFESPSRKRKAPGGGGDGAAASSSSSSSSSSSAAADDGAGAGASYSGIELDDVTGNMTVEQYLQSVLDKMKEKVQEITDEAVDAVGDVHKANREDIRNLQHQKRLEQAARNKAAKKKVWDVHLTVAKTSEEQAELVGRTFVIHPRQRQGGMCKIGRSSGEDFGDGRGVSLPKDWGVSTWHGKFTSVYGTIYYTDLSKYGTRVNSEQLERDQPRALKNGDELELGCTVLAVKLVAVAAPAGAGASSSSAAADGGADDDDDAGGK